MKFIALFISVLFRSVPIFAKFFSQSKSFENRINNRINGSKKSMIQVFRNLNTQCRNDVIGWEQTEWIKCDFSAQFIPFFDWLKKICKNRNRTEQNRAINLSYHHLKSKG